MPFPPRELAVHCAWIVDQKGGSDVRVLELPGHGGHAVDYAVIVTAGSDRLTNALVDEVWHWCKRHGIPRHPVEGEAGWMLLDCYDVVVHALSEEKRAFYALDQLWKQAKSVDWSKERKSLSDPDKPVAKPALVVDDEDAPAAADAAKPTKAKQAKRTAAKATKTAKAEAEAEAEVGDDAAESSEADAPAKKQAPKRRKSAPRTRHASDD